MSLRLVQYRRSDGAIRSLWEASTLAHLLAQQPAEDEVYGYLVLQETDPHATTVPDDLSARWYVVDEVITAKTPLTITASPSPFAADGLTACLITVSPFLACTLLVNREPVVVTADDPTLELTSDVPATFRITMPPLPTAWADPLTVEAT